MRGPSVTEVSGLPGDERGRSRDGVSRVNHTGT